MGKRLGSPATKGKRVETSNQSVVLTGVGALARIIGKNEDTVRDLERRGVISAVRDSANRRQFTPDQVQAALAYYQAKSAA
jgi:tellurite resistance protein